eukprot:10945413-Heterocapsa_arctica.AAC.1
MQHLREDGQAPEGSPSHLHGVPMPRLHQILAGGPGQNRGLEGGQARYLRSEQAQNGYHRSTGSAGVDSPCTQQPRRSRREWA